MTDDLTLNEGVLIAAGQAAHQVLLNYDTPVTWVQAHVVAEAVLAVVAEQLRQQGRDEPVRLLDQAMHLGMNGERAPGGNETWRDWWRRVETYLRSLS